MFTYSFDFERKVIVDIIDDLRTAPRRLQQIVQTRVVDQLERDIAPLKAEPPEPTLPFVWSTNPVSQRRAAAWYFANKVKNRKKGGRYKRTHGLSQGWQVDASTFRNSILLSVYNPAVKAVRWTQSIFQVVSHKRSGWEQYEGILLRAEEKAQDTIIEGWFEVLAGG